MAPTPYPVFSKPIINLKGMGVGSPSCTPQAEYEADLTTRTYVDALLQGDHVSSDLALVEGEPRWWRHARAARPGRHLRLLDGLCPHEPAIENYCGEWSRRHLARYTGIVNSETIGGRIIEVHLRIADQWPDLYGEGWVEALVRALQ